MEVLKNIAEIESELIGFVSRHYLPKSKRFSLNFYAPAADELSKAFTSDSRRRAKNYFNQPPFRAAYLLYFYLQTYSKVEFCIRKFLELGFKIGTTLDVGAGPGPASLAAASCGAKNVVMIDQNKKVLDDAMKLGITILPKTRWSAVVADASRANIKGVFDCIILANTLSELTRMDKAAFIENTMAKNLDKTGGMIIVEPALRFTSRALMQLRDQLIARGLFVHAPCLHEKPCPMLKTNNRDWCHMYLRWNAPRLIADLDRLTGRNHRYLKFSYIIVSKNRPKLFENTGCVVSSPLISKGKTELLICSSDGKLLRERRLHKDGDEDLRNLNRGDLVHLSLHR